MNNKTKTPDTDKVEEAAEIDLLYKLEYIRNNTYDLGKSDNKQRSWMKSYLHNLNKEDIHLILGEQQSLTTSAIVEATLKYDGIDTSKKANAITYEQLLTLSWCREFNHKYKPGYDNIDGNYNYFGTSKQGMRIISVNATYAGHTFIQILGDGGTRKLFNGHVRSFEELKLINDLVL